MHNEKLTAYKMLLKEAEQKGAMEDVRHYRGLILKELEAICETASRLVEMRLKIEQNIKKIRNHRHFTQLGLTLKNGRYYVTA